MSSFLRPQKPVLVLACLILGIGIFAYEGYQTFYVTKILGMDLRTPVQTWITAIKGSDSGAYLQAAYNFANGHGLTVCADTTCADGIYRPFIYWGPGTPWIFGMLMKLTGQESMLPFFIFLIVSQAVVAWFAGATVALFTANPWLRGGTVFLAALGIPMKIFYFSPGLTSSENAHLIPFAAFFYFLTKMFCEFWTTQSGSTKAVFRSAGLAGFLLGIVSLIRDSNYQFALFLLVAIPLLAFFRDRTRVKLGIKVGLLLLVVAFSVRFPVQRWNKKRVGAAIIASSSNLWREGVWFKHDEAYWYYEPGFGMAEYLDPSAAADVAKAYHDHTGGDFYSFRRWLGVIVTNPVRALHFKVQRLPIFLGTRPWPDSVVYFISVWCAAFYLLLATYLVRAAVRRTWPNEVTYLYMVFLGCCLPIIHFEFRYSFPIWFTLPLVPAFLALQWQAKREAASFRGSLPVLNTQES